MAQDATSGRVVTALGTSPLTQYVNVLVEVPSVLRRRLDRDAEAMRMLTSERALDEVEARTERRYWDKLRQESTGEIVASPRVWTRRDESRVNIQRGLIGDNWVWGFPECRAARYLQWLEPDHRVPLHDQWFRLALEEARIDGMAAIIGPKLEQTKATFQRMIAAARSESQDEGGRDRFDAAAIELGELANALMDYTKPGAKAPPKNAKPAGDNSTANKQRRLKPAMRAAQLLMYIQAWHFPNGDHGQRVGDPLTLDYLKGKMECDEATVRRAFDTVFKVKKGGVRDIQACRC